MHAEFFISEIAQPFFSVKAFHFSTQSQPSATTVMKAKAQNRPCRNIASLPLKFDPHNAFVALIVDDTNLVCVHVMCVNVCSLAHVNIVKGRCCM